MSSSKSADPIKLTKMLNRLLIGGKEPTPEAMSAESLFLRELRETITPGDLLIVGRIDGATGMTSRLLDKNEALIGENHELKKTISDLEREIQNLLTLHHSGKKKTVLPRLPSSDPKTKPGSLNATEVQPKKASKAKNKKFEKVHFRILHDVKNNKFKRHQEISRAWSATWGEDIDPDNVRARFFEVYVKDTEKIGARPTLIIRNSSKILLLNEAGEAMLQANLDNL